MCCYPVKAQISNNVYGSAQPNVELKIVACCYEAGRLEALAAKISVDQHCTSSTHCTIGTGKGKTTINFKWTRILAFDLSTEYSI